MVAGSQLVIDTSVWINLLATEHFASIVRAIGALCIAPRHVLQEVLRNPRSGASYSEDDHPLIRTDNIRIVELDAHEIELFVKLVSGTQSAGIGDDEAAAIAVATSRKCALALDDFKAQRVAKLKIPDLEIWMSADLLTLPTVTSGLGTENAAVAFQDAVKYGRMHVPRNFSRGRGSLAPPPPPPAPARSK